MASPSDPPPVEDHAGILVARDDRYPGGTKARYLVDLFDGAHEVVYASPAEGGAQFALAAVAAQMGKQATIFVAARKRAHARAWEAKRFGAKVIQVRPGYLTVVQARARQYAQDRGVRLAPFGVDLPGAVERIAAAAQATWRSPDEVWCAAGSGVLARGLARAWPQARLHAVQVGRKLTGGEVAGATVHPAPQPFGRTAKLEPPFPADPHYEAKAWEMCRQRRGAGTVLFWNVTGPAA